LSAWKEGRGAPEKEQGRDTRHDQAADDHDDEVHRHQRASWYWAARKDTEKAELDRHDANIDHDAAKIDRERARLERHRDMKQ